MIIIQEFPSSTEKRALQTIFGLPAFACWGTTILSTCYEIYIYIYKSCQPKLS